MNGMFFCLNLFIVTILGIFDSGKYHPRHWFISPENAREISRSEDFDSLPPGKYLIKEHVFENTRYFKAYGLLYVIDHTVFLLPRNGGYFRNALIYRKNMPDIGQILDVVKSSSDIAVAKRKLGASGSPFRSSENLWLFNITDRVVNWETIGFATAGNNAWILLEGSNIRDTEGYGIYWYDLHDKTITYTPQSTYGTPYDIATMSKNFIAKRRDYPFVSPKVITVTLSQFFNGQNQPGLYLLSPEVSRTILAPYSGLYVTRDHQILLCPRTIPWSKDAFFYLDQCYYYTRELPTIKSIRDFSKESKDFSLSKFLTRFNLDKYEFNIEIEAKICFKIRVPLFTIDCDQKQIQCCSLTLSCRMPDGKNMIIDSMSYEFSDKNRNSFEGIDYKNATLLEPISGW